jgi:hypothetical protein
VIPPFEEKAKPTLLCVLFVEPLSAILEFVIWTNKVLQPANIGPVLETNAVANGRTFSVTSLKGCPGKCLDDVAWTVTILKTKRTLST